MSEQAEVKSKEGGDLVAQQPVVMSLAGEPNQLTDTEFLLYDLKVHHSQAAWDWDADSRFAEHCGIEDTLIEDAINSCSVSSFRIEASKTWKKPVTDRRLRGLRRLIKEGRVYAFWVGAGAGGMSEFGVGRVRGYALITSDS